MKLKFGVIILAVFYLQAAAPI